MKGLSTLQKRIGKMPLPDEQGIVVIAFTGDDGIEGAEILFSNGGCISLDRGDTETAEAFQRRIDAATDMP